MCTAGANWSHNGVVEPHGIYGDVVQQSHKLYIYIEQRGKLQ